MSTTTIVPFGPIDILDLPPPPLNRKEKLQIVVQSLAFAIFLPLWTVLSTVLIGPTVLLKKITKNISSFQSFQHTINTIYAFCTECFSLIGYYIRSIWKTPPQDSPLEKSSTLPVLLVHGYLSYPAYTWEALQPHLQQTPDFEHPVYTISLGETDGHFLSLQEYQQKLSERVSEIRKATGLDKVLIVAHSMGGLVSVLHAIKYPHTVAGICTLGTPFKGMKSSMKYLALGPNGRQMRPDSEILQRIQTVWKEVKKKHRIDLWSVASNFDAIVPLESATGLTHDSQKIVSDCGHQNLVKSEEIKGFIYEFAKQTQKLYPPRNLMISKETQTDPTQDAQSQTEPETSIAI